MMWYINETVFTPYMRVVVVKKRAYFTYYHNVPDVISIQHGGNWSLDVSLMLNDTVWKMRQLSSV